MGDFTQWVTTYLPVFQVISSIATSFGLLIASLALLASSTSAYQATRAHDFKTLYDLKANLSSAWLAIPAGDPGKPEFKTSWKKAVANLANEIERACFVFNHKIGSMRLRRALENYLVGMIALILEDKYLREEMKALRNRESEFKEMRDLLRGHRGAYKTNQRITEFIS